MAREVDLLREQRIEFLAARVAVGVVHVVAQRLLTHVVDLQREDRQSVDGPRGGLGVEARFGAGLHILVFVEHVGVDVLHHVVRT